MFTKKAFNNTIVPQNLIKLANSPSLPILLGAEILSGAQPLQKAIRLFNKREFTRQLKRDDRRRHSTATEAKDLEKPLEEFPEEEILEEAPEEQPSDPYSIIRRKHEEEFKGSAIHRDLMKNFETFDSNPQIMNELLIGEIERINSGRVAGKYLHMYGGFNSGWLVRTEGSDYIQFKPDPEYRRLDAEGKEIKYENPTKFPTDIFRLRYIPVWLAKQLGCDVEGQRFWEWVNEFTDSMWISEGAKKVASLLSNGILAVGLPGINNLANTIRDEFGDIVKRETIPALVATIKNKSEIVLCLDAPERLTQIEPLISAYRNLRKLIHQYNPKCEIKIACWTWHLGKGIDDVIAAGHWHQVKVLPYYEALRFINTNIPATKRITGEEYLNLEHLDHLAAKVIGIRAAKNSGKTWNIARYLKALIGENEKIINVTHRIKLGRSQAALFGLYYLKDTVGKDEKTLAQSQVSLCINSLTIKNGFDPKNWQGATIILDEVVQLINHMVGSGTVKDLPEVINNFKHILLVAKKVILMDADLDYKTLKFFDELLGEEFNFFRQIKIYEFHKEFDKMPMTVRRCHNRNAGALCFEEIMKQLLDGKKVLGMTDSKSRKSSLSVENLVNACKKEYLRITDKELRVLAVHAENTKNQGDEASKINSNPDIIYDYDLVLYTSVLGTGVSFEKAHFDVVIGSFVGGLSVDEILQGLYRYRLPVPRIVFIPRVGMQYKRDGSELSVRYNLLNYSKVKKEIVAGYGAIATERPEIEDGINHPVSNHHAQMRSIGRLESDNFLDFFLEKATEDYKVDFIDADADSSTPEIIKTVIKEAIEEKAEIRSKSEIITNPETYENMKAAETLPEKDFNNFDLTGLAKKYELMDHPELLSKELSIIDDVNRTYHSGIKMHYFMDNLDYAQDDGEDKLLRIATDVDKFKNDPFITARIMLALGAKSLRNGETLHREHPTVKTIIANFERLEKREPGLVKRHLKLNFNPKDPMTFVESLATKQGLKPKSLGRTTLPNGSKVRGKIFIYPDEFEGERLRDKIYEVWRERDAIQNLEGQERKLRNQIDKLIEQAKSEDNTIESIDQLDELIPQLQSKHDEIQSKRIALIELRNEKRAEKEDQKFREVFSPEEYEALVNF